MLPDQVANKLRKIIETDRDLYTIQDVYFNPKSAKTLASKVPELGDFNIYLSETETESEGGTLVSAQMRSAKGQVLDLGTILLDGSAIMSKTDLMPYDRLVDFIIENAFGNPNKS